MNGNINIINDKWLGDWVLAEVEMGQQTENFYWQNLNAMDGIAEDSFLKALKIPVAFFKKLDDEAKRKVIHSQVELLPNEKRGVDALWVLLDKEQNRIMYAGKRTETSFGSASPETFFGSDKDHWTLFNVDREAGTATYMRILADEAKEIDKFYPVVMVTFSLFYQKLITMRAGLFKPMSSAFLIRNTPGLVSIRRCNEYEPEELNDNIAKDIINTFNEYDHSTTLELNKFIKDKATNFEMLSNIFSTKEWTIKNKHLKLVLETYSAEYAKKKEELELRVRTLEQFIDYCFVDVYTRKRMDVKSHLALGESLYLLTTQLMGV